MSSLVRAAAFASLLAAVAGTSAQAAEQNWAFRVLMGDKPIGTHRFTVDGDLDSGNYTMRTEADFKVKIAFVTVYSYIHDNIEQWRDGCLQTLDSTTTDGGKDFEVQVRAKETVTSVESNTLGEAQYESCQMTFSYWKQDWLQRSQLINSQNGELLDVAITELGPSVLYLNGAGQPVNGWRVKSGDEVDITVWYHQDNGRFMGLRSRRDGRVINYLTMDGDKVELPAGAD